MLKYIFFGSPPFSKDILERLCADYGIPTIVVSQSPKATGRGLEMRSTAVAQLVRERGLSLLETADINAPAMVERLSATNPDALIVVAFGQILKNPLLQIPRLFAINLHGSLLPKYRGAAPIQRAIWNGDTLTGVSIQKMTKKLDAGEVILQQTIPIDREDTTKTVLQKMVPVGARLLVESLRQMKMNAFRLTPQDETAVSYAPKLQKTDSRIHWNQTNDQILNQIRATIPWPVCEARFNDGLIVKIWRAELAPGEGKPGIVSTDHQSFLRVQCGRGRLSLTVIQPANRKPVEIAHFFSGFRGTINKVEFA